MKTIHDLKEHESILVSVTLADKSSTTSGVFYPYVWQVTRVATGWIYQNANPNIKTHEGYFVPLTYYTNPTP